MDIDGMDWDGMKWWTPTWVCFGDTKTRFKKQGDLTNKVGLTKHLIAAQYQVYPVINLPR